MPEIFDEEISECPDGYEFVEEEDMSDDYYDWEREEAENDYLPLNELDF